LVEIAVDEALAGEKGSVFADLHILKHSAFVHPVGLSRLNVFRSRRFLLHDYTPPHLPHRERQREELQRYFRPVIHEMGGMSVKVHVQGDIGTGKTALCRRFGRDIEAEASKLKKRLKYVHVNLAYTPRPYQVMTRILDEVSFVESPRSGLSPEEMLTIVARTLSQKDYNLVIALDEVDTYLNEGHDPKILYMLSRAHELYQDPMPRVSLIYISRSLEWMRKLDKATLDTIGRVSLVQLQPYGHQELRDILAYRAEEAFKRGAVSESIIDFIADIAVSYGGVRYGLELLLEAGGEAEADNANSVGAEHVRRAHANIPKGVNGAYYPGELSLHKQLLLKGIVDTLGGRAEPYTLIEEVYEGYQSVCEAYGEEPEDESTIRSYLKDLNQDGYILLKEEEGENVVSTEFPVDRMAKALEASLKHAKQASEKP